jgi:thiamine transport system permease protein
MSSRWPLAAGIAATVVLFYLPLGWFFGRVVTEGVSVAQLLEILGSRTTRHTLLFTTGQAALSAAVSVLFALPGAYLVSHYSFRFRRTLLSISLVPFVLPSIIVVICMISFYGKRGLLNTLLGTDWNLIYNFGGILIAHVFYNVSLALRVIAEGWQRIDRRHIEAATSLGDSCFRAFRKVTLPLLSPSLVTAFALVFIYCFLSFGIVLVFGGVQYATLEVQIYKEMFVKLDLFAAGVYAGLQLLVSVVFLGLASRAVVRTQVSARGGARTGERSISEASPTERWLLRGYTGVLLVFLLGPILGVVGRAVTSGGGLSLESFQLLFRPDLADRDIVGVIRSTVPEVIGTSVGIALFSGTLTFLLAVALALYLRGKPSTKSDSYFQLPLGVSVVTVAIGLRMLFGPLLPAFAVIVIGHLFITFPLVFRLVRTTVEQLPQSYVESAQSLGARRVGVLRDVIAPVLSRGLLNAYAYSLAIPFADFTMVLSSSQGAVTTFPVAIYRLIGFRSFDLALALGVIYMALCFGLFLWIDRTSYRTSPGGARAAETVAKGPNGS